MTKTLILNSAHLDDKLILNILKDAKNYDIYLINYNSSFVNNIDIETSVKKYDFNSFNIFIPKSNDINEVEKYLESITEESVILFIGLENIFLDTSSNATQFSNGTKKFNYFSYDNIDTNKLISFIENLYNKFKLHCLFLLQSSLKVSQRIAKELEQFDIDVLSINYENDNEDIQSTILNSLKSATYEDSLSILDKYKSQLTEASIRSVKVMIWLQHGFRDKAIEFLKTNYENLEEKEKKQLADFYYFEESYPEAYTISYHLFKKNPFIIGLNTLLLKIAINTNQIENIYKEVLEFNPKDIKALELCADYFSKDGTYKDAIKYREQIFNISNEPTQLLLIEMLKIKENTPRNGHLVEKQISNALRLYKDDDLLEIEKSFKLGTIWLEEYRSYYKAYYHFKDVLKVCNNIHSVDAAKNRMMLLSNHGYARKIIKEGYQKRYPDKLPIMRINELFNSLLILTHDKNGYIEWQSFIDDSQTTQIWKKYLAKRTIIELKKIDSSIKKEDIENSLIFTQFKDNELIKMARLYKGNQFSLEQIQVIKEASEAFIAQGESRLEQIWVRYYIANFFTYIAEMQLANNHSISLWHFANQIDTSDDSIVARLLGTLSWGMAQFKNGKEIEGIVCILVTIKHFININEVLPFIEDALGVLNIWIHNNKTLFDKEELDFFFSFYKRLTPENAKQEEIYELLANEDWKAIYNLLGFKIYNVQEYNSQWALDFHYYIIATSKLDGIDIDFNLLINSLDNLIEALIPRKDQRAKVLYSMAQLIFISSNSQYSEEERCKYFLKLLEVAIKDLEEKRKTLKNIYERSFISDENKMIYELYLVVNILVYRTNLYKNEAERIKLLENIFNGFDYLSLRTLKERKQNKAQMYISDELKEIEREYLQLINDLSQFMSRNFKDAYLSKEYKEKSERYGELRKSLEKEHPIYKNDLYYEKISIADIQSKMEKDEIYYQYNDTDVFICYLIINKDFIDFGFIRNMQDYSEVKIESLTKEIQNFMKSTKYDIKNVEDEYYNLSLKYFSPLFRFIEKYKKVYINHDLSIPFISSNMIRLKSKWLIEDIDFVVNVMNRNYFFDRSVNNICKFAITTIGKKSDKQILQANNWIGDNEKIESSTFKNFEDNIQSVPAFLEKNDKNSIFIISHGIQGTISSNMTGALSIDGEYRTYNIDDFKFIDNLESVALLTCSSGSLSLGEYETSNSIVSKLLTKKINSALLCRWDVFVEPSLKIYEKILISSDNLEVSLNKAINEYIKENSNIHPVFWAGIEIWKN